MLNPYLKKINLSKDEYKEYARHLILDKISMNGQKRLKKAKVLFIGAGGLAASAILYLISSGIGEIGVVDNDRVSQSNLHRQILYTEDNINELKVHAIKAKINHLKPNCKVYIYAIKLSQQNSIDIIKKYDVIIDACDNFETRYIIDKTCYQMHKIHIYGAIEKFQGQVSVFNYKSGPKYSDIYPRSLKLSDQKCNTIGVFGLLTGIIGLLQAIEAIKVIIGTGEILSGKILTYNSLNVSFKILRINTKKIKSSIDSESNEQLFNKNLISKISLQKLIKKEKVILVDVRQNIEFSKLHIKKSLNIPIKNLNHKNTQNFFANYCQNKTLIIYCSNDSRSIIASNILHKNNIKHYRLRHGFK